MQRVQEGNSSWTQDLNQESIDGGRDTGDDEFAKFLEYGNDFPPFEDVGQSNAPTGLDTPMGRLTFAHDAQLPALTPEQQAMLHNMDLNMGTMQAHIAYPHTQQSEQYQQYALYQQIQNLYHHQVPPTPVSAEMQGAKYGHPIDSNGQIIFDRQTTSFPPLVSPAQTPIDHNWGVADYVVADDFFSPLTSPAIEAQQSYVSTATSSPIDLNVDHLMSNPPNETNRKPRRKLNPTSRVLSSRNLRSTPAKPMSRRRQLSLGSSSKENLANQTTETAQAQYLQPSSGNAMSSEDSVSPEPLVENLMRPPPLPQSKTPNTLRPQSKGDNAPVTPSTLMKISGKQAELVSSNGHGGMSPEIMEDISLPAAAASEMHPRVPHQINTSMSRDDDQSTPTMSVKTPKLSADSTPRSTGMRASGESHDIATKLPAKGGRQSKKRQSVPQAAISPALRPKISPSISPLVPSTGPGMPILSAETSALYLASKSNYQNIIDGTHLPGVSYPETLAENLSSKRTSHKIAEQGRRNRINLALKEIESLLPASITAAAAARKDKNGPKDEADANEKSASAQGASKASTVEMAIIYIRSLQAELKETKDKLEAAEKSLTEGHSGGSQTSD